MVPKINDELIQFLDFTSKEIEAEYSRIRKRATEDPVTAGDQGEENWANLLRQWLPSTFHIVTKGRILNESGIASPQVDILILRPEYPQQLLDKKLYLSDGVLAAFECKLTLKTSHLTKFFNNSKIIKTQIQSWNHKGQSPYRELNSRIVYGLLAHSHSWKSKITDVIKKVDSKILELDKEINHPILMPNLICISDMGTWSSSFVNEISDDINDDWMIQSGYTLYSNHNYLRSRGDKKKSKTVEDKQQSSEKNYSKPIASLIQLLLYKISWEYPNLRPIARYFRRSFVSGGTSYIMHRSWDKSVLSDELTKKLGARLTEHDSDTWDEWSSVMLWP